MNDDYARLVNLSSPAATKDSRLLYVNGNVSLFMAFDIHNSYKVLRTNFIHLLGFYIILEISAIINFITSHEADTWYTTVLGLLLGMPFFYAELWFDVYCRIFISHNFVRSHSSFNY